MGAGGEGVGELAGVHEEARNRRAPALGDAEGGAEGDVEVDV